MPEASDAMRGMEAAAATVAAAGLTAMAAMAGVAAAAGLTGTASPIVAAGPVAMEAVGSAPPRLRRAPGEGGSSVVTFVMALPLLLLFLFAVIDLGRMAFLHMALDDAAYAACRAAQESPAARPSAAQLRSAALIASPALAGGGLRLAVTAAYGEVEEVPFASRFYDGATDGFAERTVTARTRPVTVEAVVEGGYLTPLGPVLSALDGSPTGSFRYRARSTGTVDATVEGGG